jgi:hypothetical protein
MIHDLFCGTRHYHGQRVKALLDKLRCEVRSLVPCVCARVRKRHVFILEFMPKAQLRDFVHGLIFVVSLLVVLMLILSL